MHDERVIRQRQVYYRMYLEGALSLAGLEQLAPMIAETVRKTPPAGGPGL